MIKPQKCAVPKRPSSRYCLNDQDMDGLIALIEEANGILDFYSEMPQNLSGIVVTALIEKYERLTNLIDTLRDDVYRVELIGEVTP